MIEYVIRFERRSVDYYGNVEVYGFGLDKDGKRIVVRSKSVEEIRDKLKYLMEGKMLIEFMGLGWRCKIEDGRYVWSRIRDLEYYIDDLCVDRE